MRVILNFIINMLSRCCRKRYMEALYAHFDHAATDKDMEILDEKD